MRRISALTGVRRVIIIAAAAIAAMAFLPAIASAAEENPPPNEGNAFVEVFLVEMGWTPAQGWPPAEYASPDTLQPIHWSEVEEKGEVPLEGGHNDPELSVERIASIVGVPLERLSSLAARNHYKEYVLLDRPNSSGSALPKLRTSKPNENTANPRSRSWCPAPPLIPRASRPGSGTPCSSSS